MPFKSGQSGNPKGRPRKGKSISDTLETKIDKKKFAEILLEKAYEGDVQAIKLVMSYLDGNPVQQVQQEISGGLAIRYVNDWRNPKDE